MEAGKKYNLTVSADVFAEKTHKIELAHLVREQGWVYIEEIIPGTAEQVAVVSDGSYQYDIPESLWIWFAPLVDEIATVEEAKAPEEKQLEYTNKLNFIDPRHMMTINASNFSLNDIKTLSIQTDFGINLNKLEIIDTPGLRTEYLMKFIMKHILTDDPLFVLDNVTNKTPEEKEAYLWELYKVYERKLAIENIYDLVVKEREQINKQLTSFEYARID